MALGWFTHLAQGRAVGYSRGSEPADQINPIAIAAMAEVGIDITGERPESVGRRAPRQADVVITMGCGDTCPYLPGTRYEDWPLTDPAGLPLEQVRPIRDQIADLVNTLLDHLTAPEP